MRKLVIAAAIAGAMALTACGGGGATSALNIPASLSAGQVGVYVFSTTIPAGPGPYTIELVGVHSIVVAGKQLHHLQLTC